MDSTREEAFHLSPFEWLNESMSFYLSICVGLCLALSRCLGVSVSRCAFLSFSLYLYVSLSIYMSRCLFLCFSISFTIKEFTMSRVNCIVESILKSTGNNIPLAEGSSKSSKPSLASIIKQTGASKSMFKNPSEESFNALFPVAIQWVFNQFLDADSSLIPKDGGQSLSSDKKFRLMKKAYDTNDVFGRVNDTLESLIAAKEKADSDDYETAVEILATMEEEHAGTFKKAIK